MSKRKRELMKGYQRASSSYKTSKNTQAQSLRKWERKSHIYWLKVHSIL